MLGKQDFISIGKGALIAVGGALLVYLGGIIAKTDFGAWTPLLVALASILVNIGRKLFDGEVS